MTDPRARGNDLTAKARIRNAALDLYAEYGEDRVSMRTVADEAGVTVGLVQHHFKTKDGLRAAVEQLVVDYFLLAIETASPTGTPAQIAANRDEAVRDMLETHPAVVNYIRRTVLDPQSQGRLLERLVDLTRTEISKLRNNRIASTRRPESTQVIGLLVRQLGQLFLQPMIDEMWDYLAAGDTLHSDKPVLSVTVT
ncbi:TetR/AcrR family transcriptional regulator [[Mycobacterium] crassicus]|uniref:Helix-turn-helix domain-containing protein n=1 Tax=[Mycobacterium] crassicus TaxID=2872309 RepID=A0ABU5XNF2_9MYCO|nr:TetR/AcrR family transcriptional regulator [Mycolicibacter sp. MYC098]MEB3022832.1 helix-turn-helix domain-containing protein [Mycolicibacter sp. MYC098]